ncbi:MAG TPA: hypothetical protein VJ963_08790 [Bacteroidales bacterium]|nr:hypothetical protein [Bacteroidales bacterium]
MITSDIDAKDAERMRNKVTSAVKDRLTLCLWWLSIPVYTIAVQYMKTWFLPRTLFRFNIHDLIMRERSASFFLFVILPLILIIINSLSIRDLFKVDNNIRKTRLFNLIWANILEIFVSLAVLFIFFI